MMLDSIRALVFPLSERVSQFLSMTQFSRGQSPYGVSMEVTPGSSGFPGEAGSRRPGTLSVPSVVPKETLEGSVGPSLVPGSSFTAVSGRPLLVDGSRFVLGWRNAVTDVLRRKCVGSEWTLHLVVCRQVFQVWAVPQVVLFAMDLNHCLLLYVSPLSDPGAWKEDSFVFP
ncbi:hypothetical protein E2C01_058728 [Portunus trituberculatus]|uniref:Uncharacterized protein n=1 Tax=Portunus trituberculatus TaxID=210409 RepID=A0A5B7GX89_PORTR|nr:hypothetical protein [Portunus trituberculatus]